MNNIDYEKASEYWADVPATVDGVLGGFGYISDIDINGSALFLKSLLEIQIPPVFNLALDCGAGIGRITKFLLIPHFQLVDIVEADQKFIDSIKEYIGENSIKLGSVFRNRLQDFIPQKKYDVIWNQWVLGYLNDQDLVDYLIRCRNALNTNGVIVIKENVTSSGLSETDTTDSSVTRSLKQFLRIFKQSNLRRIKQCKQTNFPNGIYPVYMFALVSMSNNFENSNI